MTPRHSARVLAGLGLCALLVAVAATGAQPSGRPSTHGQSSAGPTARFGFDGEAGSAITRDGATSLVRGVEGRALRLGSGGRAALRTRAGGNLAVNPDADFTVQYWLRTTAPAARRMAVVSHKDFPDNSLASQKNAGWVSYVSDGTWAWSVGSGDRRLTYERDNGALMPVNDGRWHLITMTYDRSLAEVRLYYDGGNRVVYNVADAEGFDFAVDRPLIVGSGATEISPEDEIVAAIREGAVSLQALVDAFDALGAGDVRPDELVNLIVEPERYFEQRVDQRAAALGAGAAAFRAAMDEVDFEPVSAAEAELMRNPYTIHQAFSFMEAAPLLKIYSLRDGEVVIDERVARSYSERERLYPASFDIDEITIWDRPLTEAEILVAYAEHFEPTAVPMAEEIDTLTAGVWNIFHGGKHFTVDEHGWDSRWAIAEILRRHGVDVVMMQETYSSGDFIAAELGYYFATTVDWDYLNQGANISVLSRYPIEAVWVDPESPFNTVAARVRVSEGQRIYVMSNWYGMPQFPSVFAYNEPRFAESATIPTLFGGDFNAVPHTDGGDSAASPVLLAAGFIDAYRDTYPSVEDFPGATHRNGRRIDQLFYKGAALRNTGTELVTTWPTGFPADHNLILATFDWSR